MKYKLLMLLLIPLCYAGPKSIIVSKESQKFSINLIINSGTGYQWFLESYDSNFITPIESYKLENDSKSLGATETIKWEFGLKDIKVPTITKIVFQKLRPWEAQYAKPEYFYIIID